MNWSGLPPLNSLRAFVAVAETGSYIKAGAVLNVTHAAVGQQVRTLEERLSVSLVVREGRGIRLTKEGMALARDLESGFSIIHRGVENLMESSVTHPVQLSTSPAFATEWLMPRIQDFQSKYPDIPLMLNPTSKVVELKPGGIEIAIRYQDKRKVTSPVTPVLISDMVVIAAPSLIGGQEINHPATLTGLPWLQELGTNEVTDWFSHRGVKLDRPLMISQMPGNLIMQAVRRGDGVTYTARAFFEAEIQSGEMKVLFSEPAFGIYYIVTSPGPLRASVKVFLNWLKEQSSIDSSSTLDS
ncbi:MAG: LysR family transcriptional regulator [Arenicellales bacterium]|nr:LysR family transcriptional regulator [Arenicellales bacterium]